MYDYLEILRNYDKGYILTFKGYISKVSKKRKYKKSYRNK